MAPGVTLTKMGRELWDSEAMAERKAARLASIPLGRFAEPSEIASIALFLASDASAIGPWHANRERGSHRGRGGNGFR